MHPTATAGGVYKAVVTDIYPDVGKSGFQCVEKHQVAGLQLVNRDTLAELANGTCAMGQGQVGSLLEHVLHKSTAIKPGFGRFATVFIGRASERQGAYQHVLHGGAGLFNKVGGGGQATGKRCDRFLCARSWNDGEQAKKQAQGTA